MTAHSIPIRPHSRGAVNPLLGDESFTRTFGRRPDAGTDETLRVRTHLAYVEGLLRKRPCADLPESKRRSRTLLLNLLRRYWTAGVFPSNTTPEFRGARRPCFIDASGTICAVGYLIEQTAGSRLAEHIRRRWNSAFVSQMVDPSLEAWMQSSGLIAEELAMIQPGYWEGYDEDEEVRLYQKWLHDWSDENYRLYFEWRRRLDQPGTPEPTLKELDETIGWLTRVDEQARFRNPWDASMVRADLIGLRRTREQLVAKAALQEPPAEAAKPERVEETEPQPPPPPVGRQEGIESDSREFPGIHRET